MTTHRSVFSLARISALLGFLALAQTAGCDGNRSSPGAQPGGRAMINLGIVPDSIACVRVTAAGDDRSVVRDFAVQPGDSVSDTLTGLPIGSVTFSAGAYSQDCASVTKSTVPTWISDEKTVTIAEGKSASVSLTLYQNGRAKVTVAFADAPDAGADAGSRRDAGATRD